MKLEEFINDAIDKLIEKDRYLLDHDVNERAITHKLAEYMQEIVGESLNVDCEYNRNINEDDIIKRIYFLDGVDDKIKKILDDNNKDNSIKVIPDIIVHKRGKREYNTIIVEVKKFKNSRTSKKSDDLRLFDDAKLKLYTSDEKLKYSYGVYIEFSINKDLKNVNHKSGTLNDLKEIYIEKISYYENGKEKKDFKDDDISFINKSEK